MPMLAEQYDYVIGGDPDRDTVDLAVLDTATAGVRAHLTRPADAAGYERMLSWAQHHVNRPGSDGGPVYGIATLMWSSRWAA